MNGDVIAQAIEALEDSGVIEQRGDLWFIKDHEVAQALIDRSTETTH